MSRIFASLAVVATLLILIGMFLGIKIGDYNGPYQQILQNQAKLASHAKGMEILSEQEVGQLESTIEKDFQLLEPMQSRSTIHKLLAILAAIVTVLVNSIAITYFIGTNRWCKEVIQTYSLDAKDLEKSNSIKRRSFPWSFIGIVAILSIAALGAASDPATFLPDTHRYVEPHFWTAMFGVVLLAYAFMNQYKRINQHSQLVDKILNDVKTIRTERGLEVEG